ncbi:MAG: hypothetical protein RLZZ70_383 [Candidatus Parcubacteria bacterium]|jgi:glutamate racemase
MKIGFFDSGLGGLVVMRAVRESMPQYDYIFYGDTANLPYGNKTEEEIYTLTREGVEWLFEEECALVIVACNTASAATVRRLQNEWLIEYYPERKLLGVIVPMVEEVLDCGAKRAVLIATERTIASDKYPDTLAEYGEGPQLFSIATPALVPLIEQGKIDEAVGEVSVIVEEGKRAGMDSLILGCTHYALLRQALTERYGSDLMIFSPDLIIPPKVYRYLERHQDIKELLSTEATVQVYLTENRPEYDRFITMSREVLI